MQPAPGVDNTNVMGTRLIAGTIDYIILPLIAVVVGVLLFVDWMEVGFCSTFDSSNCIAFEDGSTTRYFIIDDRSNIGSLYLTIFAAWTANLILLQGLTGASIGKFMLGLRVVNEQGNIASFGRVLLRSILWLVDGIGCVVPLVGPITALASSGHRRVGDMAAKTYVVKSRSVGQAPMGGNIGHGQPVAQGYGAPAYGAPGYGAPGYGAPGYGAPQPQPGVPEAAPMQAGGQPQWDPQRNAWVQFDPTSGRLMQYDDAAGAWREAL